jgi:AraC-like DNA-binding protein
MGTTELTQWADAGLQPSPEAMRDHLLIGLLQEGMPLPRDYPQRLEQSGIRFQGSWFGLIELRVVAVDAYAYVQGLGHRAYSEAQLVVEISELLKAELSDAPEAYLFKVQSEIMCILCGQDRGATEKALEKTAQRILDISRRVDGIRMFAATSDVLEGYEGLGNAKCQVRQLFEYRALHLDITPILTARVLTRPPEYPLVRQDIEKEQEILAQFRSGNFRQASRMFGSLFDREYLALATPLILLKHKCAQYLDALIKTAMEMMDGSLLEEIQALAPEQRLLEATSFPEVRAQMEHFFGHLNDLLLASRKSDSASWIMDVKNFIRSSYTDPDLNVNRVADEFGKNPSYLSRSFLRFTGTSILDYIHYYRIQEAKILIGRGVTLAAAAEAVGYSNVLTMSRAFKKYEGTTPGKLKS